MAAGCYHIDGSGAGGGPTTSATIWRNATGSTGFSRKVDGSELHRAHGVADAAVSGDHQRRRLDAALAHPGKHVETAIFPKAQVEHDEIIFLGSKSPFAPRPPTQLPAPGSHRFPAPAGNVRRMVRSSSMMKIFPRLMDKEGLDGAGFGHCLAGRRRIRCPGRPGPATTPICAIVRADDLPADGQSQARAFAGLARPDGKTFQRSAHVRRAAPRGRVSATLKRTDAAGRWSSAGRDGDFLARRRVFGGVGNQVGKDVAESGQRKRRRVAGPRLRSA